MKLEEKELASFLRMVADEVEKGASMEGLIRWTYTEGPLLEVGAFVRNGNDQGQGGVWLYEESKEGNDE